MTMNASKKASKLGIKKGVERRVDEWWQLLFFFRFISFHFVYFMLKENEMIISLFKTLARETLAASVCLSVRLSVVRFGKQSNI